MAGRKRKWPALGFRVMRRGHGFLRDDWLAEKLMDTLHRPSQKAMEGEIREYQDEPVCGRQRTVHADRGVGVAAVPHLWSRSARAGL